MIRIRLVAIGAITTLLVLGSSLMLASQPSDEASQSGDPAISGGLGHYLKK